MSLTKNNMTPTPRPDIAEFLRKNMPPVNYIHEKIFPDINVRVQAGTLYYKAADALTSAQTGRGAAGAVTTNSNTDSSTTFDVSTAEILSRQNVDASKVNVLGGEAAAEAKLARRGFLAIQSTKETAAVTALAFGSSTDVTGAFYAGLRSKLNTMLSSVQGYQGKFALVGGGVALQTVRADTTIVDRMKNVGFMSDTVENVRAIANTALAQVLGIDVVIEGPNANWPYNKVALLYLPDQETDPIETAQLGRRVNYVIDEQVGDINCVEGYDPVTRTHYLDFVNYSEIKLLNSSFKSTLQVSAATTTTTSA